MKKTRACVFNIRPQVGRPAGGWVVGLVILALAVVSACGGGTPQAARGGGAADLQPVSLGAGEKLRVAATTNIVGDVVRQVGGDHIELTTLMGIGVDPHSYAPTPADTAALHDAHLIFTNGAGLEANLETILESAGGEAVEVAVSQGIEYRRLAGHAEVDPHVWFDVQNVIRWVETIERTLSELDPANAGAYAANARAYIAELEALDAWIMEQAALVPEAHRKLVTNHPVLGYFADRYGFEQPGAIYPISPASEPSAQDIAALEDAIRAYGVPAVFVGSAVNPRLAEQVAQDTGVRLVALYTGSLGRPGSGAETYLEMMRYDVGAIVDALR